MVNLGDGETDTEWLAEGDGPAPPYALVSGVM
jgi:hypothetical protein